MMFSGLGSATQDQKRMTLKVQVLTQRLQTLSDHPKIKSATIDGEPALDQIKLLSFFLDQHVRPAIQRGEFERADKALEKMSDRLGSIEGGLGIDTPKKVTKPSPVSNEPFERPFIVSDEDVSHEDLMPDWADPKTTVRNWRPERKFNWLPIVVAGVSGVAIALFLRRIF